jgi:GrpB-like predicted nucleotidyltransferase (UPF0157 family)
MKKLEVLSTYDKKWPQLFNEISGFLKSHLKHHVRIEHIGSTAIPGMIAKAIIDIDIEISNEYEFKKVKKELEAIGYTHEGNFGIEDREAFTRSGSRKSILDNISHHLYVCTSESQEYKNHIKFRNQLSKNPDLVRQYNYIKKEIIKNVGEMNRQGYVDMKAEKYKYFFEHVIYDMQ